MLFVFERLFILVLVGVSFNLILRKEYGILKVFMRGK